MTYNAEMKRQIISETKALVMLMASPLSSCSMGKFGTVKHLDHMFKLQQHLAICLRMMHEMKRATNKD